MNCNVVTVYVALKMGSIVFFFTEIDAVIHTVYYTVLIPITLTKRCTAIMVQGAASSEVHCYLNAVMMRFIVLHCTLERAAAHVCLQR